MSTQSATIYETVYDYAQPFSISNMVIPKKFGSDRVVVTISINPYSDVIESTVSEDNFTDAWNYHEANKHLFASA